MKPSEIYVGLRVVTSDAPDATIYTVRDITVSNNNRTCTVGLAYQVRRNVWTSCVWVDYSILRLPAMTQMVNA